MRSEFKLALVGIAPLAAGYLLNFIWTLADTISGIAILLMGVVFLALWGYAAYKLSSKEEKILPQVLSMCAIPALMLLLVLYQEIVREAYWGNIIGSLTQLYFLPWLTLASLFYLPIELLVDVVRVWPGYIIVFILLSAVSFWGIYKKKKSI